MANFADDWVVCENGEGSFSILPLSPCMMCSKNEVEPNRVNSSYREP